ncbi:RecT family recombinase [Fictibacillus sp. JL2B1089]|uniref:RecT family recombinase n=1 Tax=Fictibacillus sp. JL2B1089 TaxID=3399565 RepID=UPI003A894695
MSKNQLAPINTNQFEDYFTEKELQVVVNSIAKNATNEELALFVQICKNNGLNPFMNHIYFIKYGNQMSIQVSVEGIQYLARQKEDYRGSTAQLVHENDEFEIELDSETQELKIAKHSIKVPRGKVVASYAIAKREGYPDKVIIIEADEVEHLKKKAGSQWGNYYNDMFKKHALKRALKAQFGIEVDDQDSTYQEPYEPTRQRVDITPNENVIETEEGTVNEEDQLMTLWGEISKKQKDYGWTRDRLSQFIEEKFKKTGKELALQEVVGLSKLMELEYAKEQETNPAPEQEDIDFDKYFEEQE